MFERDGTASRPAQSQREAKLGRARSSTDNGTQLPRPALRRQPSAVLRLQRLAGNKAVAEWLSESPPAAVQRSPGDINDQDLLLHVVVGGDSVAWVFPVSEIGTNATQFLKGSSGEIAKIEAEVAKAVAGPAGLLAENRVYLESPPVAADLQKDVEDWPAKRTLTRFPARLAARAQAVKDTRLRYPLETQIATSAGISPAQIDWRREIAAMRAQPPDSTTMVEASRADRFDLALQVLEEEAAAGVQPVGNEPLHTLVFKPLIYAKYAATDPPPSEFNADALTKTHSEAFLTTWLPKIRYVRLVPDNFDLSPFAPTGDLDPVRKALVEKYIDEAAPRTMEKYLLDMWTADALKRSPEQFLKTADLGGVKGSLVTHLAKDFHRWARTQPDFHGAFWAEVGQRAAFAAVTAMFTAGRAVQKYNENLAERFEHAKLLDLDQEEFGIAKDPYGYLERLEDAAKVTNALTQTMTPGKSLEGNLLGWYEGALTAWSPGTPNARMGALLLGFVNTLDSLKKTVEAQEKNVGKELSKDLTTSYPKIEAIIRNESRYAEEFITSKWIPMLKTVALEQITKNRDDMKEHVAKWPEYRERTAAKFRICAHVLDDLITRLNSGDLDSIELDGQLLTKDQVPQLENARDFMQGQADTYADESDAEEKKDDMQDAVDGFEKVRKRILSGDYKPVDYTKAVYDEARKRLGLTGYADLTTMGQALDRWVVVPDNPFLAYAIARWQWEEHVKELDHEFKVFLALGLLTLASLVVPGAAGVVLTAIDIGVGIAQGIGAVQDAYALLDMAKLDDNGTVRGVTVEQARAALKTAWIGLGLNILLAGAGIATLFGRLILKGRGAAKIPGSFTRLSALAEVNPAAAEKMLAKIKDMAKVESLLEITAGDSLLLEKLLDKTHDVAELEFVLMHGDPRKMAELVDLAGDSTKLARVLENSPSVALAEELLKMTDDAEGLALLLKTADDSTIAKELLQWAKDPALANKMLSVAGDQKGLINLSKTGISPQVAADSLAQVENAEELAKLTARMDAGPDQVGKLLQGRTGKELNELLDSGLKPNQIEVGVGTPRVGPQPTFPSNAVPVTPEIKAILSRYGIQDAALLQQMQPHELARIKSVFGTDRIAAKARPLIQDQAIKWALDGAKSPGDFANRWEYFTRVALPEARAEVARSGLAIPRGKNLDIMAAEHVLEPAQWTQMTAKLAAREEAVQKLAGTGWVNIGEHAGADAVRANGTRLTFGSDTSAAYHVQAHYGELAPTEAAAAAASPSEQTASYVASARRTVVDGTFVGASAREGATTLTFNRKITDPVTNAVTVVETKVIVRDQYALIATHGRPLGP